MSLQLDNILLISTASKLVDELSVALPALTFHQLAFIPAKQTLIPALVLIDYTCIPKTPIKWQTYQHQGSMILFRIPADDVTWLDYVSDHSADEFIDVNASTVELAHRIKRLLTKRPLNLHEMRYQELFIHHPEAIYLHDLQGNMIDANNALLHLFDWTREELPTLNLRAILGEEQFEYAKQLIKQQIANEQPRDLVRFDVAKHDGQLVPVEICSKVIWRDDQPWAVQGVARLVRAAPPPQHLQEAEERYRLLASLTANYTYVFVNVAGKFVREWGDDEGFYQLTGYTHAQIDARGGWQSMIYEEDTPIYQHHRELVDLGQVAIHDYRLVTAYERIVWLRQYSLPVVENGVLVRIYGAIQDITDLKEVQHSEVYHRQVVDALHNTALTLTSTLDFNVVLDRILTNLARIVPYDMADVMLVENDRVRIVRHKGYAEHGLAHIISDLQFNIDEFMTFSQMTSTQSPILIEDVHASPMWVMLMPPAMARVRSYIGAPLYFADRLVGFLNLNSHEVKYYTSDHAARVAVFASQVSIAISNARLHDLALQHSLELEHHIRDLMLVYEIGRALAATLDLETVYMLLYHEVAQKLFGASQMMVVLHNKQTNALYYSFAVEDGIPQDGQALYMTPDEQKSLNRVMSKGLSLKQGNAIYEPLINRNRVIGILKIVHYTNFNAHDLDIILPIVANLAASAVENAQLYATINQQRHEMTALYRATTVLFESDNPKDLAKQVTNAVAKEVKQADCALLVVNSATQTLEQIARSEGAVLDSSTVVPLSSQGVIGTAVRIRQTVYVPDISHDLHYLREDRRIRSELCIPLFSPGGVIGVLHLQSAEVDAFSDRDRRILQAIADRVAAALENHQLLQEIRLYASDLERRVEARTIDLQRTLAKERELSEIKTRFVQTVSHEFRTPLTAILSAKEMLQNYGDRMSAEQHQERYRQIEVAVNDIVYLIEESLLMNRMTEGNTILNPIVLDMVSYTQSIIDDFSRNRGKSHRIVYTSLGKEAVNLIDSDVWRKVVLELLHNATKFSEPGTEIDCKFMVQGADFVLSVKDHGIGISPEDLPRVWGMFDRGANAINIPGTGLGLAIVKQFIEQQGGTIKLESRLGHGTTVTLNLPKYVLEVVP